jgi:HemX protein
MDRLYISLATLFYAGGFCYALACLRSGHFRHSSWNYAAMAVGLLFQTLFLGVRGDVHGSCPVYGVVEKLVFVSWSMVIIYLLVGRTYRLSLMGVFTSPLVFVSCLLALLLPFDREAALAAAELRGAADRWGEMHKGLSLLAYGAFGMSFISGLMYLIQERQVRRGNLRTLFYNLPPMQHLAAATFRLALVGTILLSGGILSAYGMKGGGSSHMIWPLYVVWAAYALFCVFAVTRGVPPRALARTAVFAFALPILSLWMIAATS